MPTAIVTGASGFVGSHLVDLLLEKGWNVTAALRRSSSRRWLEGSALEVVEVDFTRPFRLPPCDVVFHVAGVIRADSWEAYLEGNRDLARRVFEGASASRFVHVSTLAVQGPLAESDETTPCVPISLYGRSKWEGEREVWERRDRLPVTVIRPPVVYGPRDLGLLDLFKVLAAGLRPVIGAPKRISIVHVRDLVEGMVAAATSAAGADEVFYLCNSETRTMSEILELVDAGLGGGALALPVPDRVVGWLGALAEDAARLLGRPLLFSRDKALEMTQSHWCCSPAKAGRVLGWSSRIPLEAGLKETLHWYQDRKFLRS